MEYYVLFAHLETILVKTGDKISGQTNVGIIGASGNSTAKHLHLQVETGIPTNGEKIIRGFDKYADPTNPAVVINEYGIMCQNDPTQSYWNQWVGNSSAICNGHHSGIDYSGNIDKPYESKYCYTPAKATCEVIETGSDPYNPPNWGGYGNYVIIKITGKVSEMKLKSGDPKFESSNRIGDCKYSQGQKDWYYRHFLVARIETPTYDWKTGKKSGTLKVGDSQIAYYAGTKNGRKIAKFFSYNKWHYFFYEVK